MMEWTQASFHTLIPVGVVGIFQILLVIDARKLYKQGDGDWIDALEERFKADIENRAKQGISPDWSFYRAEAEAHFEQRNEHLRTFSSLALALGLASTILALIFSIIIPKFVELDLEPGELIQRTGISLLGSLVGVGIHLWIVSFCIRRSEDKFFGLLRGLMQRLTVSAGACPPSVSLVESLVETLKNELSLIRGPLTTEVASTLAGAVKGFPKIVEDLGGSVSRLSEVVQGQGASIERAAGALVTCATMVATAGEKLLPIGEGLASSAKMLGNLPDSLAATMKEGRDSWLSALAEQYERSWQELIALRKKSEELGHEREERMAATVLELSNGLLDLRQGFDDARINLVKDIANLTEGLGLAFGREARDVLNDAAAQRQAEYAQLLAKVEEHERVWRNEIGAVVTETFGKVEKQFRVGIIEKLGVAAASIQASVSTLPQAAEALQQTHEAWLIDQSKGLEAWRDAADLIQSAAANLSEVDGVMRRSANALDEGVGQVERALRLKDDFKKELAKALAAGAQGYLEELRSIHERLATITEEAAKRSAEYEEKSEKILLSQAKIIEISLASLTNGGNRLN